MFDYRTPGVYFEQVDNRSTAIGIVRTDIAAFVGIAQRGPLHRPVKIQSWNQYQTLFGTMIPQAYLAYAVEGFFSCGGATCWVVRIADPALAVTASCDLLDDQGHAFAHLTAASRIDRAPRVRNTQVGSRLQSSSAAGQFRSSSNDVQDDPGSWGNDVSVTVQSAATGYFNLTLAQSSGYQESFPNLALDPCDPRYFVRIVNGQLPPATVKGASPTRPAGSRLVVATDSRHPTQNPPPANPRSLVTRLAGGQDGIAPAVSLNDESGSPRLRFAPASPSLYSDQIEVQSIPAPSGNAFSLLVSVNGQLVESWQGLTLTPSDPTYVLTIVNNRTKAAPTTAARGRSGSTLLATQGGSSKVVVQDLAPPVPRDPQSGNNLALSSNPSPFMSADGGLIAGGISIAHYVSQPDPDQPSFGLQTLAVIDEVSIVAVPDLVPAPYVPVSTRTPPPLCTNLTTVPAPKVPAMPPEFGPSFSPDQVDYLIQQLVLHCQTMTNRIAVIDVPPEYSTVTKALTWKLNEAPDTNYGAAYFPWLLADDPLLLQGVVRAVPPSGHVAGIYASTDRNYGVHKPPANEELSGVEDLVTSIDDNAHGLLNDQGINAIRAYPGRGIRVFGARTLSSDLNWRFLNVRRLLLMIEVAIDRQTQWVVFEPNNTSTRVNLVRVIRGFLKNLWQAGMLDGATADDAFEVACDDSTTPPSEAALGRLICLVGVQPPAPAEFVVVRIGKTEAGTEILDD